MSRLVRPVTAYRLPVRVRFHECDPLGHVNNAVYLNWLEQAAIDHAALVGWSQENLEREVGGVFVARRHEIDYLRPAYEGDHLEVVTWPDSMQMATALRRYVIRRAIAPNGTPELIEGPDVAALESGEVLVRAVTRWALIRREAARPLRIPKRVIDDFLETGDDEDQQP
ncbi:MAG TPA: acyl-CoA thioesterase [Thermomicrobiales bacterium]|nr:acyl-CoA thioesterase [Thermomicrobiales bacterium]